MPSIELILGCTWFQTCTKLTVRNRAIQDDEIPHARIQEVLSEGVKL